MKPQPAHRIIALILTIYCFAFSQQAHAFLGFGDEERLPGKWEGPAGFFVIAKDGNGTFTNRLHMSVNFNWAVKGGKLTMWGKDNTISGFLVKALGISMEDEHPIKFKGSDEFTIDGQLRFNRQK